MYFSVLVFIRAWYQFSLHMVYIEGTKNTWVDAISQNYPVLIGLQVFKSIYQRMPLLEELLTLFMVRQLVWMSDHWIKLFRSSGLAPPTLKVYKTDTILMDLIHYSFAPLILFHVPYMLDLLPYYLSIALGV